MQNSRRNAGWFMLLIMLGATPVLLRGQSPGSVSGTVVDVSGAAVGGATIQFSQDESIAQPPAASVISDPDGQFSLLGIAPGAFQLSITASGFALQTVGGVVTAGQLLELTPTVLKVADLTTNVDVTVTRTELAEDQVKAEEQQRLLGIIPNYYVTYLHDATLPLTSRQKFEIAWKTTVDPVSIGINAIIAGVEQSRDDFAAYGQGMQGYGKRFGAAYADLVSGTMISGAILPSLLKQDPRYYYKGSGSKHSRFLYAIASAVICKGDNGKWEPNYSSILGGLAAGGLSNLYYPPQDRGAGLTFANAFLGIAEGAAGNVVQEFFFRKLTPKAPHN